MIDKNTFIKNFRSVHDNLPIGAVATSVGATTLSNIFALRELTFLKDIFMNMAAIVALFALLKLFFYSKERIRIASTGKCLPYIWYVNYDFR